MSQASVQARKDALRAAARTRRRPDRAHAARQATARLLELVELRECRVLSLYAFAGDEVPVETALPELRARGLRTVFPRVSGCRLLLAEVEDPRELAAGYRGIREPRPDLPELAPEAVDLYLVPGVLFDRRGRRLGRGRGYYDRLLALARPEALRVGCSYADRVVDELPVDPHDVPMHLVLTEEELIRVE